MDKLFEKIVFNRINSTGNEVTQTVYKVIAPHYRVLRRRL